MPKDKPVEPEVVEEKPEKPAKAAKADKPAKEKKAKKGLTKETEVEMLCPYCGAKHDVWKAKKAYYIKHEDGDKKLVFKLYIRRKMPRVSDEA